MAKVPSGNNLTVQARTVQAVNTDGNYVNATVFGAFAFTKPGSPIFNVAMSGDLQCNSSYFMIYWAEYLRELQHLLRNLLTSHMKM